MTPMMTLQIVSPERMLFEGEVEQVSVPGTAGAFVMLPGHAPIISSLASGTISFVTNSERRQLQIAGGFMEQRNNRVSICVEL